MGDYDLLRYHYVKQVLSDNINIQWSPVKVSIPPNTGPVIQICEIHYRPNYQPIQ